MTAVSESVELIGEEMSTDLAAASLALARRFHAGATMWVLSPEWEPHAHHVAVEFVHPVVVGKRALPAFALVDADAVGQARLAARPGDVILAMASAADVLILDVMRRAPAWGAETVWIGFGPRPTAGSADHVLWVESDDPMVPATGRFVLMYHLLWELTHVCFEHPGLLTEKDDECVGEVCLTCSDEGRLGEVVLAPESVLDPALVRTATGEEDVDVTLVGDVRPGDLVLVHAGAAITRLEDLTGVPR
jgi:hypothetical protein